MPDAAAQRLLTYNMNRDFLSNEKQTIRLGNALFTLAHQKQFRICGNVYLSKTEHTELNTCR